MKRRRLLGGAAWALLASHGAAHAADAYPSKPVVVIAPSGPGGGYDFVGRLIGQALTTQMKQSFVVENRAGSGTLVGTQAAANAAPDGCTLLIGGLSNMVFNAALYPALPYDAQRDFVPVALVARYPYVLAARGDLPQSTAKDLIAAARAQPGQFTIATVGSGSGQQVLAAAFARAAQVKLLAVPYRSAQAAYQDLLAGRVDLFFDTLPSLRPHLDSRRARALFITSAARNPVVPVVPTAAEAGLPMLEMGSWFGLFAPRKTPVAVVAALRTALASAMNEPQTLARLHGAGIEAMSLDPAQTDAFIRAEFHKWTDVIRQAGITAE